MGSQVRAHARRRDQGRAGGAAPFPGVDEKGWLERLHPRDDRGRFRELVGQYEAAREAIPSASYWDPDHPRYGPQQLAVSTAHVNAAAAAGRIAEDPSTPKGEREKWRSRAHGHRVDAIYHRDRARDARKGRFTPGKSEPPPFPGESKRVWDSSKHPRVLRGPGGGRFRGLSGPPGSAVAAAVVERAITEAVTRDRPEEPGGGAHPGSVLKPAKTPKQTARELVARRGVAPLGTRRYGLIPIRESGVHLVTSTGGTDTEWAATVQRWEDADRAAKRARHAALAAPPDKRVAAQRRADRAERAAERARRRLERAHTWAIRHSAARPIVWTDRKVGYAEARAAARQGDRDARASRLSHHAAADLHEQAAGAAHAAGLTKEADAHFRRAHRHRQADTPVKV